MFLCGSLPGKTHLKIRWISVGAMEWIASIINGMALFQV